MTRYRVTSTHNGLFVTIRDTRSNRAAFLQGPDAADFGHRYRRVNKRFRDDLCMEYEPVMYPTCPTCGQDMPGPLCLNCLGT